MLAKRIKNMNPSATVELTAKVLELKRAGVDVISLNVGEPDFDTPENISEAGKKAIDSKFTRYTTVSGIFELKKAICKKLLTDNNVEYKPDEIIVSTGGKQVLINAVLALCEDGDEVLLPVPSWVSYIEMIKLAGSTPVMISTEEENGFQLDIENIKRALNDKTKAIIINTPNNPTGAVYTEEVLRKLGELAVKHNFYIISDEIYEKLIFDKNKHISIASLSPEIKERTIIINGFSKAYAMTGWRLGYGAGPKEIIRAMISLQGHMTTSANSISQKAAVEAICGNQDIISFMVAKYDERRKYLLERLNSMDYITCTKAEGAFYLMPNVSGLFGKVYNGKKLETASQVANFFLEEAHIAVVPGEAFEAPENVRIAYSNSLENIKEAMDRIEEAVTCLK